MFIRPAWAVLRIGAILLLTAGVAFSGETIRIVEDGKPRARVVIPADCDGQTRAAAELLVQYVKQSSGAELPVAEEGTAQPADLPVTLCVGLCECVKQLAPGIEGLDDDGFVIRGADGEHIVIAGPTPHGTEFGVCEFLERYVGVRWLMPGPQGDDVPPRSSIDVSPQEVRQEPAFFSRLFSGLQGGAQGTWARRNRMHGRVSFHHYLQRLFPPETYTKTHPHFFPLRDGKRYLPATNDTHGWQPCFCAEGIVEEAVKNICRYFDENPRAPSYSLGVVDSSGHCQCDGCQAKDTGQKNFLGRRDVSDRYYDWCNQVVEGVLKKHPGKFFGCLAYSEVAQPPSRVKVHERIVPYLTYDRMKWIDPEIRAEGQRITKWWQEMSPVVGWYDYIYGSAYCVPRVWFHQMGDYYRFGHAHGVRALYAEAYPNWGEGPKLYVSLKLQWDPRQNVDELLREWYVRAVGAEAADDLAAYYALWEDFWTRRILDSKWFTKGGQYLGFNNPAYLANVTEEDVVKSRELLERVVQKASTPQQKARANLLMLAFEYYEASAVAYRGRHKAEKLVIHTETEALDAFEEALRCQQMGEKRRRLVTEVFPKHPELLHQIDFGRYTLLRGDDWETCSFWRLFDWAGKSDGVRNRLCQLAASPSGAASLHAKSMLMMIDKTSGSLSKNPSFEDADGNKPAEWYLWVKWGIGTQTVAPEAAHSGKLGVLCKGMKRGGPVQGVEVTPGNYAAVALVRVPRAPKGNATITLAMTPMDEEGNNLPDLSNTLVAEACDWTRIATAGEVPEKINGRQVKKIKLIVLVNGFGPEEEVHLDDVALFRVK